jgi:hypothetical protein
MPATAIPYDHDHENEVVLFGQTNFRNQRRKFGIKTDDRRRHVYVIGKTGMGKTTLLENMVLADIYAGHGLAYIDPHGDSAEKFLDYIPAHRINDVVYFNPADMEFPIGFNILETIDEGQKHLVASGLMGVFKKIWPDVWSPRMEYILLNTILALLDYPGSTLMGINRLLSDEEYRGRVVALIQDPVVKTFWVKEFASFSEKYRTEAVAPVQNKVGQFLSAAIIRNTVAQVKSTIDMRDIMDTRKIFIVNLSKGRVGEENSRLLGAMIITRLQLAAMERVDIPEKNRQDFYMYVDEFQNFATESFANILSEARKYRLALIVAHQYIEQLDETVSAAIFGNVGTIIAFRVGAADAAFMENEFMPRFTPEDLVNLKKYEIYLKLMIDGAASEPFSANTLAPIAENTGSMAKVIRVSRERYSMPRKVIEDKVIKWAGFGTADTGQVLLTEDEEEAAIALKIEELEKSSPNVGEMAKPSDGGGFGGKKKKKPQFEVPCSVCGKISELTFEPDWSKPWFCKEHLEMKQAGMLPKVAFKPPIKVQPRVPQSLPDGGRTVVESPAPSRVTMPPKPVIRAEAPKSAMPVKPAAGAVPPLKPKSPPPATPTAFVPVPAQKPISLSSLVSREPVSDVKKKNLKDDAEDGGGAPDRMKSESKISSPSSGATSASGATRRAEPAGPSRETSPNSAAEKKIPSSQEQRAGHGASSHGRSQKPTPPRPSSDAAAIPFQTHKPRIVFGGDDREVLFPDMKKPDEPSTSQHLKTPASPASPQPVASSKPAELAPKPPEPLASSKPPEPEASKPTEEKPPTSDKPTGGSLKPGQVVKF